MRPHFLAGLSAGIVLIFTVACGGGPAATVRTSPAAATPPAPASVVASAPASVVASAPASAAPGACDPNGTGTEVGILNFKFDPAALNVSTGTTVSWFNGDTTAHTVTFDAGPDCGRVEPGAGTAFTFSAAGTFAYHCAIHPNMKGTVTVQ